MAHEQRNPASCSDENRVPEGVIFAADTSKYGPFTPPVQQVSEPNAVIQRYSYLGAQG